MMAICPFPRLVTRSAFTRTDSSSLLITAELIYRSIATFKFNRSKRAERVQTGSWKDRPNRTKKNRPHGPISMQPELALKAISHTVIALSFIALLIVLLISLKQEMIQGTILLGAVHLCSAVIGVCAFICTGDVIFSRKENGSAVYRVATSGYRCRFAIIPLQTIKPPLLAPYWGGRLRADKRPSACLVGV
jgi:hypothetical protein